MVAKEIMTKEVVTVSPTTTVKELARILTHQQLSGVPVVNPQGQIVGVASEADIVTKQGRLVKDIMSEKVYSITEETPVEEIAVLMKTHKISRLPVVRGDTLIGIVSRADIVGAIATGRHFAVHTPVYDL
jgi:CBS domain-containing protein